MGVVDLRVYIVDARVQWLICLLIKVIVCLYVGLFACLMMRLLYYVAFGLFPFGRRRCLVTCVDAGFQDLIDHHGSSSTY